MLISLTAVVCALATLVAACNAAEPDSNKNATTSLALATAESDAEPAIRQTAEAFAAAFNRGDAKAVAALWTADGDYVDENGARYQGRAAIQAEYAECFARMPGTRMRLSIDSIRQINDGTAIEDGRATLDPLPPGPPAVSRYTAVHVKQDGKWRLSSVHDTRVELPSNYSRLAALEPFVGNWNCEHQGNEVTMKYHWMENKNFLVRSFSHRARGEMANSGMEVIGWDRQREQVTSWTFDANGGHATARWLPTNQGWHVESSGVLRDGTPTHAMNLINWIDAGAYAWQSMERSAGAVVLANTDEVIIKRTSAQ